MVGSDEIRRKDVLAVGRRLPGIRSQLAGGDRATGSPRAGGSAEAGCRLGNGASGSWKAVNKKCSRTARQYHQVHKTTNVLNKALKVVQPKIKEALHGIRMGETREEEPARFLTVEWSASGLGIHRQWNAW